MLRGVREYVPGIRAVRDYQRAWLPKDLVAGLVLTALLVPQGMAYAELAGLPAITGLYTSILCLVGYALFGPSRVLVLGPDSSLGPMIAATIIPLLVAGDDPDAAIALASMLALIVGAVMLIAGIARLGFVADLLSKPTQVGYLNGLALVIIIGQLPKFFGFSVDADGLVDETRGFIEGVRDGETIGAALAVGVLSLAIILLLHRWLPRIPAVLVAVIVAILTVVAFDLTEKDVSVIGPLPQGFPPLTIPATEFSDVPLLVGGALGIALVALADTVSTASVFAARQGARVRGNQEMIGIGAANIGAGLFQGFPVSTSTSRTAVAEQAGSKSQLTGVIGAAAILLLLLAAPDLLRNLPQPALAAIVISAAISLADIPVMVRLWRVSRSEFWLAVAAFAGVAFFGVLEGIAVAVALSILNVFRRVWWPYQTRLGRTIDVPGYHDVNEYPDGVQLPGVVVYRFDAPLIFANARTFRHEIMEIADGTEGLRWIIVASEPITDVDTTASDMLQELDSKLDDREIALVFAEMKNPVRLKLERYGLKQAIGSEHFFPTVRVAVEAYQAEHGVEWPDPALAPR